MVVAAVVGLAVSGAVAVVVALTLTGPDESPTFRAADRSFSVALPDGWSALEGVELDQVPSGPAAVLRRDDRRGLVVIHRRAGAQGSWRLLTRDLTHQLRRRFRDVRPVGARTVPLRAGAAYVYTFARPGSGTVQSIAVAAVPGRTYTLDAVTAGDAPDVAAQIGAIVRSFDAA